MNFTLPYIRGPPSPPLRKKSKNTRFGGQYENY